MDREKLDLKYKQYHNCYFEMPFVLLFGGVVFLYELLSAPAWHTTLAASEL